MALSLGSQTGSLSSHVMSLQTEGQPEPTVGMGATLLGWTDRYAATVTMIEAGIVTVQEDYAKRVDANGMSDVQTYEYTPDARGLVHHYCFRNNFWEAVQLNERTKRWVRKDGYGLRLGERCHYYDYSY